MGDFKHKHSLGQNFLKDKKVLLNIIDSVDVNEDEWRWSPAMLFTPLDLLELAL